MSYIVSFGIFINPGIREEKHTWKQEIDYIWAPACEQ